MALSTDDLAGGTEPEAKTEVTDATDTKADASAEAKADASVEAPDGAKAEKPARKRGKTVEETAEFVVVIPIAGTRNGEPWPGHGETIELPVAEGAQYVALGYVKAAE